MKIMYINGYKESDKESSTYLWLRDHLPNDEVIQCNWWYDNGIDVKSIAKFVNDTTPDIIVSSSTGCLIAESIDVPKVLINPVIERVNLEELFENRDFSNLPERVERCGEFREVIVSNNDEVLDYTKALIEYKNVTLVNDNHRLMNKAIILEKLNNLKEFINSQTQIL